MLLMREQWLKEAERCESEGSPRTCEAIVKATVAMELEDEDRLDTWVGDAPTRLGLFLSFVFLYFHWLVFKRESLDAILNLAVIHCPQAEVQWLMAAKEKWLTGDVPAACEVLERAFVANPESEQIWLAAVKLEAENGE